MLSAPPLPKRYQALRPLGRGGEGMVFLVRDSHRGGALLALKVIGPPAVAGRGAPAVEPRADEFLIQSRLAHPALSRVWDFAGLPDGQGFFFTSDYAPGVPLLDWTLEHPVAVDWSVLYSIAGQVLGALHAVHSAGFVHGDVKPAHIIVRDDPGLPGAAKVTLIDFGSARLSAALSLERRGTPAYLAPASLGAGPAADLYAVGLSLFQGAAGRLPFALGDPEEPARFRRAGQPARLTDFVEGVPATAAALVERLTAPSGERFQSAADALEFLSRKTAAGRPTPPSPFFPGRLLGRDGALRDVLSRIRSAHAPLVTIAAPPGLGKSRLLQEALRQSQLEGFVTLEVSPDELERALAQLGDLASGAAGGKPLPTRVPEALGAALLDQVAGTRVLLGLDGIFDPPGSAEHAPASALDSFSGRAWLAFARRYLAVSPGEARLCIATTRPDRLRPLLDGGRSRLEEVRLDPLGREALREMVVDVFRTEAIPERVIDGLAAASGGAPGRAREAIQALVESGARTDPLGMLVVPSHAPASASTAPTPGAAAPLSGRRLQALAIAALLPEAVDAAGVARYAREAWGAEGDQPAAAWESILEELYWSGQLLRGSQIPPRYRLADPRARDGCRAALDGRAARLWSLVLRDLAAAPALPGARDADRLAALARAARESSEPRLLGRSALGAVRWFKRSHRFSDALSLVRDLLAGPGPQALPRRALHVLILRAAELALLDGGSREGQQALERLDRLLSGELPPGVRARALRLAAEIEEHAGAFSRAALRLEEALASLPEGARWYEASARLAALHFTLGRPALGAALLQRGMQLDLALGAPGQLGKPASAPSVVGREAASDLPVAARALCRFGTLLSRHGDPRGGAGLLETALGLARLLGRKDLQAAALHELALVEAGRGMLPRAERALAECETLSESTGDRSSLLRVRVNLATLLQKSGQVDRAEDLFQKARVLADELQEEGPAAAAWMGLELIRRDRGELLEALRLGRGILHRFRRTRPTLRATALFNLGEVYLALGRPEQSRRLRARAFALARALDYRFLSGYCLMGLGAARWAVGDLRGAQRRLLAALRAAGVGSASPERLPAGKPPAPVADHQLAAAASLYLGLSRWCGGEPGPALRDLGRAMFHARRARSQPHLEGSALALVDVLLSRGERERAARILARTFRPDQNDGGARGAGRHRFLAEGLELRCRADWPAALDRLLTIAERAEAAGEVLAALRVISGALRDPAALASPPALLPARREALAARLLRRSPERDRRLFRGAPGSARILLAGETDARLSAQSAGESGTAPRAPGALSGSALARIAARWASGREEAEGTSKPLPIEAELALLRDAMPVRALWILNQPGSREPMFYAAGETGPPLDLFSERAAVVEEVRGGAGPHWGQELVLVAVPGGRGRRARESRQVLCLETDPGEGLDAGFRERVELAAALLGCYLRARGAEQARGADRRRLLESLEEVHRLNALLLGAKGQVETAVITQRLIEVESRRAEESRRLAAGGSPRPIAISPLMRELMGRIARIAREEIPVLLWGEHGAGKDLLARAIHAASPRRDGPFVSEVCTVSESLLESELFGYVRGAFTDAVQDRPGLLQMGAGGTLYLDEIGEMSPALQARLLRVIEERRARPIGAEAPVPIDLRLVSSTCRAPADLETSGVLRPDLFYRIRGEVLWVPPLRARREDIPHLARAFAAECARERGLPPPALAPGLLPELSRRDWPGNVRQLENEVRRAYLLNPSRLTLEAFRRTESESAPAREATRAEPLPATLAGKRTSRLARAEFERQLIGEALRQHGGNASHAARALRITRRYLGVLLEKHGIRLSEYGAVRPGPAPRRPRRAR